MVSFTSLLLIALYRLTCSKVLVNNLHVNVKPIYWLYYILKDWEEPPTVHKIAYASGKKKLNGNTEAKYMKQLEDTSENIKKVFEVQQAWADVHKTHSSNFFSC